MQCMYLILVPQRKRDIERSYHTLVKKNHLQLSFMIKFQSQVTLATKNQPSNKRQLANDASCKQQMNFNFFVDYEYGDFIHAYKDEFL